MVDSGLRIRLDALTPEDVRHFVTRDWIGGFQHILPVEGSALRVGGELIAIGGKMGGFPWGEEVWVATSDSASRYPMLVYKVFRGFLTAWSSPYRGPLFTTTGHEVSHRLVEIMGFTEIERRGNAVRWEYVPRHHVSDLQPGGAAQGSAASSG